VRLLLARGANVHAKNTSGETALGAVFGDPEVEKLLRDAGARR
jgi:hypothetical protein